MMFSKKEKKDSRLLKALIVEDDLNIRDLLAVLLRRKNFEVVMSEDYEAVVLCQKECPDLVILDANLPRKSGFDICKELKDSSCKAKVFMISGAYRTNEFDVKAKEAGADAFLVKPFTSKDLDGKIQEFFRVHFMANSGDTAIDDLMREAYDVTRKSIDNRTITTEVSQKHKALQKVLGGEKLDRDLDAPWMETFGDKKK